MIFRFGEYELDEEAFELRNRTGRVETEPRVFDLIAYLVRHRRRVVSKHELLREVWSGAAVSESVLPHCVAAARRALGDDAKRQAIIQTAHGRGYRFVSQATESSRTAAVGAAPLAVDALPESCRRVLEAASVLASLGPAARRACLAAHRSESSAEVENLALQSEERVTTTAGCGRELSAAVLQRMIDEPAGSLLEQLENALDAGVLQVAEESLSRYRFAIDGVAECLYESLGLSERSRLHAVAARIIEEHDGLEGALFDVARHAYLGARGGDSEHAVLTCSLAGARRERSGAHGEAADWYERALEALELATASDPIRRFELLLALGRTRRASGARRAGRRVFESAATLARQLDRSDLLAQVALELRPVDELSRAPDDLARQILDEALDSIDVEAIALRSRLLVRRAYASPDSILAPGANVACDEALALSRQSCDPESLRDALAGRLRTLLGPDSIARRLEVAEELLALAARRDEPLSALLGHDGAYAGHLLRGDAPSAERSLAAFSRLAEQLQLPYPLVQSRTMEGAWALARGSFEVAERLFDDALKLGERLEIERTHFIHAGLMFALRRWREEDGEDVGGLMFGEMMELPYAWQPAARTALAAVLASRGDHEGAGRELATLDEIGIDRLPHDEHWLATLDALGEVAITLGDRRRAAALFTLLEPYEELFVVHDLLRTVGNNVGTVLGELEALLGRYDEAIERLERAIERERAMGLGPPLWESQAVHACLLTRRGNEGDQERSEELRARIRAAREERNLSGLPRRALALERALGAT